MHAAFGSTVPQYTDKPTQGQGKHLEIYLSILQQPQARSADQTLQPDWSSLTMLTSTPIHKEEGHRRRVFRYVPRTQYTTGHFRLSQD